MTNMPISRFKKELGRDGVLENYERLLRDNFESENLNKVMCRSTLSVDWKGYVYDCDFNQMLGLPAGGQISRHLSQVKIECLPWVRKYESRSIVLVALRAGGVVAVVLLPLRL